MDGLIPLATLVGLSGGLLYASRKNRSLEPYEDLINPSVKRAMGSEHSEYVYNAASRFNPLMNLINPAKNPLLPANFTPKDVNDAQQKVKQSVLTAIAVPSNPSYDLIKSKTENILINTGDGAAGFKAVQKCEAINTIDCNAFDKEEFALSCGICHQEGRNSTGNPVVGGLFIDEDDKYNAEQSAKRMNSRYIPYSPTIGKCATGRFTTTKQECLRMKKQMECEAKQSFDVEGCSQCYTNERFHYIDTALNRSSPSLVVSGNGSLKITKVGGSQLNIIKALSVTPVEIPIPNLNEGDILQLEMSGENPSIAGYLIGDTPSGDFRMDIIRLIQTDAVSGEKPRLSGQQTVNGDNYTLIKPGRGKSGMQLVLQNVFTFVDPSEVEAQQCGSSPFITKQTSAEFLNNGPCYKKGQTPGNYSKECLQSIFTGAGCTTDGEAYPTNPQKEQSLMRNENGSLANIAQIAGNVYEKSLSAYTGRTASGNKMSVNQWDQVSRFCTGKKITSPCDFDNKSAGPLSSECLNYLWLNKGAVDNNPGGTGPTYTNTPRTASLIGSQNQFCSAKGTMAPIGDNGQPNMSALKTAQSKGGVESVKQFYNSIHTRANDNRLSDDERREAILQCYGITLEDLNKNLTLNDTSVNAYCVPNTLVANVVGPTASVNRGTITLKPNWKWTFSIRPTGVVKSSSFANIFHVTRNGKNMEGQGARAPGVWFFPDTTRLHVSMFGMTETNQSLNPPMQLPLNQVTNVSITFENEILNVKLSGAVTYEESLKMAPSGVGVAQLWSPNPWNPSFIGILTNLSFCTYDLPYVSVLDSKPGRTKTAFQQINFAPFNWNAYSRPAIELGPYGIPPWGKTWASGFPDNPNVKWIWTNAGAAANEPNQNPQQFFKKYNNRSSQPISAIMHIAADNVGWLYVNDAPIAAKFMGYGRWNIQLPPGDNKIEIVAKNNGGPAGLAVLCTDMLGSILFVSDSSFTTKM